MDDFAAEAPQASLRQRLGGYVQLSDRHVVFLSADRLSIMEVVTTAVASAKPKGLPR